MDPFDVKKSLKELYQPSRREFSIITVPEMNFLMIDGHGDPNVSAEYREAVEALYGLAYTIKFGVKSRGDEYAVPPLEGLWWVEDMTMFSQEAKDQWDWTMMIMQPPFITAADVQAATEQALRKKKLAGLPRIRFEPFAEGLAAQILYLGAYADEGPTIARLHDFIHANGYERSGKHHEIYLGDPRRTAPEKLKTVIRQPMRQAA